MVEGEEELKLDGMRGEWQEPRHFREVVRSGPVLEFIVGRNVV